MITLNKYSDRANITYLELYGLSTDTKPTKTYNGIGIANGSSFIEMDTSAIYFYSAETHEWLEISSKVNSSESPNVASLSELEKFIGI